MGPALTTEELKHWARSRGLSDADAQQLFGVASERDEARAVLKELERIFRLNWDHCPWCLVPEGHAPDCRLAAALASKAG